MQQRGLRTAAQEADRGTDAHTAARPQTAKKKEKGGFLSKTNFTYSYLSQDMVLDGFPKEEMSAKRILWNNLISWICEIFLSPNNCLKLDVCWGEGLL